MIIKLNKKEENILNDKGLTVDDLSYLIVDLYKDYLEYRDQRLYNIIAKIKRIIDNQHGFNFTIDKDKIEGWLNN